MRSATDDDDDSKSDDRTVFESTTDLRQSFVAALIKKKRESVGEETLNSMWCVQVSFFSLSFLLCVSLSLSPSFSSRTEEVEHLHQLYYT